MIKYLQIKNWENYQHYKDRNPAWIKLSTSIFQDYEFACLQDASKLLAVCCMTLAARYKDPKLGLIPCDLNWIKNQCNLGDFVTIEHLKSLVDCGFLIDDSNALAGRYQSASPEKEESRVEKEESISPLTPQGEDCEIQEVDDFEYFWSIFPNIRKGSKKRALKAWEKAIKEKRGNANDIIQGTERYAISDEALKHNGQYAKGAAAWLNDDRWTNTYRPFDPNSSSQGNGKKSNAVTAMGYTQQQIQRGREQNGGDDW